MQIAQVLAGYSLGEADLLRRAMGKKIKSEMQAQRERFVAGAVANEVEEDKAEHIFDLVDKFAGYGFNKSHSAAYALVSYQTAWLKTHYPVELLAALLSLDITNTDKLAGFILDARRQGLEVCGPDVNRSLSDFTVEDGKIIYALGAVRNVGSTAMDAVVQERLKHGLYKDLFDFAKRVDPRAINKRALENLARAGAFDSLEPNRHKAFCSASHLLAHASLAAKERESSQGGLFGDDAPDVGQAALPEQEPWEPERVLQEELAAIGFYFSGHPIDAFAQNIKSMGVTPVGEMAQRLARGGTSLRLAVVVRAKRERLNQRGGRFAFITFSDASGECEVMAPPEVLEETGKMLVAGTPLLANIRVDKGGGGDSRLKLISIEPLQALVAEKTGDLRVILNASDQAEAVKACLEALRGREGVPLRRLNMVFKTQNGCEVEVQANGLWPADSAARRALKSLTGVRDAQEVQLGR